MLAVLANRTYSRLFAAQVIALFGTGLATVALALLAHDLAGGDAGLVLGTALAIKMVAYVTIAPLVGAYAVRLPRKALLVTLDLARAGFVAGLLLASEVWQIYLLMFLLNACNAGFTPTFQATIPDILPDERDYTRAISLSRLAYDLEALLSPSAAALALLFLTYDALFALNTLAFVVSALLVLSVVLPNRQKQEQVAGLWHNLTFGLRAYLATPRLRGVLALALAASTAGAMVIVNTVVYMRERLGGGESETALAFAVSGAGSMVIALVLPGLLERLPERRVMLSGAPLAAAGLLLGLLQPGLWTFLLAWLLIGAGLSLIQAPYGRVLRRSSRDSDRPAFFAAHFALTHACWLITYPLAGWLGALAGLEVTFGVLALICLAAGVAAARLWPAEDAVELEHVHEAVDHRHLHVHDEHHQHDHEGWEGPEPHSHPHRHPKLRHSHPFVIDLHHGSWPA